MVVKNQLFAVYFLALSTCFGQTHKDIPDSLLIKDYEYFIQELESDEHDDETARIYSSAYLSKAKSEKNWTEMVNA